MTPWIRRSVGVAVLSAGLIGVASTAAQADEMPRAGQLEAPSPISMSSPSLSGDVTGGTASTTQTFISTVNQNGLVNVAIAPNVQIGDSSADASGHQVQYQYGQSGVALPLGILGR
ncbi:hypothetical protein [Cryptosporangium phraense]|uniref:Uncharacterized protein n=1 Tax=Cryptosporangium phraense TaxID=2593070 RepID=A0A545AM81_9ACTN|nr:hypothetical protein [Cryptosporangium phraense]TQS42439.1 hypothetical protein FL583_24335 [Cryptosporangium phraense]